MNGLILCGRGAWLLRRSNAFEVLFLSKISAMLLIFAQHGPYTTASFAKRDSGTPSLVEYQSRPSPPTAQEIAFVGPRYCFAVKAIGIDWRISFSRSIRVVSPATMGITYATGLDWTLHSRVHDGRLDR